MALSQSLVLERNAVRVAGAGEPVLLVHGYGCDQAMWNTFEEKIGEVRTIRYDLTGMGSSDYAAYDARRHSSLAGHVDDLLEILDALDVGPVVAVGHSVSATIVALASIRRPEAFKAIVMVCPSPCYINHPPYEGGFSQQDIDELLAAVENNYQGWAGQLAGMVAGPEASGTEDQLRTRFCKNDPWISRHFAEVTFRSDNRADMPLISVPCLLLETAQDTIVPPSVGQFLEQQIPHAKRITLDCTGHAPHMTEPEMTAMHVQRFIEGLAS